MYVFSFTVNNEGLLVIDDWLLPVEKRRRHKGATNDGDFCWEEEQR